jgi:hypothetical protein
MRNFLGRTRTLDSHASRLRRKLNLNGEPTYVVNVWGDRRWGRSKRRTLSARANLAVARVRVPWKQPGRRTHEAPPRPGLVFSGGGRNAAYG